MTDKRHKYYDIIVVGAGHAGIEAASASAKMGLSVCLITMDINAIGRMSCNPAIGGTAKGHLVKEVDALGGVMGVLADETGIQFKMLNKSKGPAVWSPRCQSDKNLYSLAAAKYVSSVTKISIIQDMVKEITVDEINSSEGYRYKIKGVKTELGYEIECKSVIITSGTFLNAVMHTGTTKTQGGRIDEKHATGLSECLHNLGFETGRLKTGTPPRLDIDTIDFSKTGVQPGDLNPVPFSFRTKWDRHKFPAQKQIDCHLTHTNERTHEELRTGFEHSPMFTGRIKGGNRPSPVLRERINKGFEIYEKKYVTKLILTGGGSPNELTEAEVSKNELIKYGVDPRNLLVEAKSNSTNEQIHFVKDKYYDRFNYKKIILISDNFHLFRAKELCRFNQINADAFSSDTPLSTESYLNFCIKESFAVLLFWLSGIG